MVGWFDACERRMAANNDIVLIDIQYDPPRLRTSDWTFGGTATDVCVYITIDYMVRITTISCHDPAERDSNDC